MLGQRRDRQVLVVGDTIVGVTLTLLLRRAGYDPLLVAGPDHPVQSQVTYLCPPALQVLATIGVGTRILDKGSTIDTVSVQRAGPQQENQIVLSKEATAECIQPVVVRTRFLRRALDERLPDRQQREERTVDTLSHRDGGLAVEFEDGIKEWFDMVVDACEGDASLHRHRRKSRKDESLAQYEIPIETDNPTRNQLQDIWHPEALVQHTPYPNEPETILRVTTPRPDFPTILADPTRDEFLPGNTADVAHRLIDAEPLRVRQTRLRDVEPTREWWGTGRVSSCGAAAYPVAPASGVGVSFGIEDALAFVSELSREDRPVSDIVDAYAAHRRRRLTTVRRTVRAARFDHDYPTPVQSPSPLTTLSSLRTVALGPFLGSTLRSLQRDGFEET